MFTQQDVANWFLAKEDMSPKKLQKMLYYAYAWVLTLTNDNVNDLKNRLFQNDFQAWAHGPVLPDIYREYKQFGFHEIDRVPENNVREFPKDIIDILNQIMDVYGNFTADELESITHQEDPWRNSRKGFSPLEFCQNPISDEEIFSYYIQRVS